MRKVQSRYPNVQSKIKAQNVSPYRVQRASPKSLLPQLIFDENAKTILPLQDGKNTVLSRVKNNRYDSTIEDPQGEDASDSQITFRDQQTPFDSKYGAFDLGAT